MANVDCIYAAVSKREMPSDDRMELILCKHERNTGMRCLYRSDECHRIKHKTYDDGHPIYLFQLFSVLQSHQLI